MSTPNIGVLLGRYDPKPTAQSSRLSATFAMLTPSQGWATVAILLLTMVVVSESINAAEWVDADGLTAVLLWSGIVALALAKVRISWILLMPAGMVVGAVAILWQAARGVEGETAFDRMRETFIRLDVWWEAAIGGGISTDLLPFFIMLLVIAWVIGFLSSWFIFRNNNAWIAVVLLGTATLTNLSFLPDRFAFRFFLFVFLAMILVVRMSVIQRHERWRQLSVRFAPVSGWLTLHATVWFSIVVLIAAVALPMRIYTNEQIAELWSVGRAPVATAEDFFSRLFAALPTKKDQPGRFFGKWLPFIGKISFGGEPVAWAVTDYPSYWLSRTYNYYTSKGWAATDTVDLDIGPDVLPPPRGDNLKRVPENQLMQLGFASDKFLAGGSFDWVSRAGTVESLEPRKFTIDMSDSSDDADMPLDIQELAVQIRMNAAGLTPGSAESTIAGILPSNLIILDIQTGSGAATDSVTLQRKGPTTPELVAWHFSDVSPEHEPYRMTSYVSLATDEDLRGAATDYGSFITDHYLQLPASLPERVRDLAERLTASSETPLDKAIAIQDYLRGPDFTYSQDIETPPSDQDGVDWFLFDTRTGYSDYFGSSMTVLLRAAGVPARMAAGYAPGELNSEGQRVIRDSDSHGWVQVYFPGYGWIDFEPTPNWPLHDRRPLEAGASAGGDGIGEQDPDDLMNSDDMEPFLDEMFDPTFGPANRMISSIDYVKYLLPTTIVVAALVGLWTVWSVVWNFGLGSLGPEARLYTKLIRLGWLAGLGRRPSQTPIEYGARVGEAVPNTAVHAMAIATAYAARRYGNRDEDDDERREALVESWKGIRLPLVARTLRRLLPQSQDGRQ